MPKQIAIIDLRGFVWADSTNFFGVSLLNCSFRSESRVTHALVRCVRQYFYGISLMESCTVQRTIVKNLSKTMELIIDFFLIWK